MLCYLYTFKNTNYTVLVIIEEQLSLVVQNYIIILISNQ